MWVAAFHPVPHLAEHSYRQVLTCVALSVAKSNGRSLDNFNLSHIAVPLRANHCDVTLAALCCGVSRSSYAWPDLVTIVTTYSSSMELGSSAL